MSEMDNEKNKTNVGWELSYWLYWGRSECELAIDCKNGMGFKWAKWLKIGYDID